MSKKGTLAVLAVCIVSVFGTGCSKEKGEGSFANSDEKVTIRLFSNLPDRKNGQGLVEQMLIDEYMEENEHVSIQVEALDDEAYKTKFQAYCMEEMPDVVNIWGQPSFLDEVLEAGILAQLDESDYKDYKFVEGSLEGFKKDGKLYGLPRGTDVQGFYYNQSMFEKYGWEIPETYGELLELGKEIRAYGIVPVAIDGGDEWPLAIFLSDLMFKITGDYTEIVSNAIEKGDFTNPAFTQAVQLMRDAVEAGLFQNGYDSQDRGTAMHLFTNGEAAMLYMGSWEAAMALDENIQEDIRANIRVFSMPAVEGGEGKVTDIMAWNGGGYAVSADSKVKEEAIRFLNFMYRPDKLSKYEWENGVGMSAQDQTEYMLGDETKLQLQFLDLLKNATNMSGTPINDCGSSEFKACIEKEILNVANKTVDIETFLQMIGNACKKEP